MMQNHPVRVGKYPNDETLEYFQSMLGTMVWFSGMTKPPLQPRVSQIPVLIISRPLRLPVLHLLQVLWASQDSLSFPSNGTLSSRG